MFKAIAAFEWSVFRRLSLGAGVILTVFGALGCHETGRVAERIVRANDQRIDDLEAQLGELKAQLKEFRDTNKAHRSKIADATELAKKMSEQLVAAEREAEGIKNSVDELDMQIRSLSNAPLEEGETREQRRYKLDGLVSQRDMQRARVDSTLKLIKRFKKTVVLMRDRLASQEGED